MVQETAPRQQVRARHAQFAGGTAAQHKTPSALVGIVEMLHRVEERRHVLRLVHHDRRGPARFRQRPAALDEQIGISQVVDALCRPREVERDGRIRQQLAQQRGLSGLARTEHEMHVRRGKFLLPPQFDPATKHSACFINARLI